MLFGRLSVRPSEPVEPDWMLELVCLQDCVGETEGGGEEGAARARCFRRQKGDQATLQRGGGAPSFITGGRSRKRRGREASGPIATVSLRMHAYLYDVVFLSLLTN